MRDKPGVRQALEWGALAFSAPAGPLLALTLRPSYRPELWYCGAEATGMMARLRTAPVRLLHALRRRAAREALRERAPQSILVVCHGNICRSPFAAAVLRQALGPDGVRIDSAG